MIFCKACGCAGIDDVECPENPSVCDFVEYDEEEFLEKYELWRAQANLLINKLTGLKILLEYAIQKQPEDIYLDSWHTSVVHTLKLLRNICEPYK